MQKESDFHFLIAGRCPVRFLPATQAQQEEKPGEATFLAVHEPYLSFPLWKGNYIFAGAFTDLSPEVSAMCM